MSQLAAIYGIFKKFFLARLETSLPLATPIIPGTQTRLKKLPYFLDLGQNVQIVQPNRFPTNVGVTPSENQFFQLFLSILLQDT